MFQIIIVLRQSPTNLVFHFKDEKKAADVFQGIGSDLVKENFEFTSINDEFGHAGVVKCSDISMYLLSDLELEYKANEERQLIQARSQKRLNDRASVDPILNMQSRLVPHN